MSSNLGIPATVIIDSREGKTIINLTTNSKLTVVIKNKEYQTLVLQLRDVNCNQIFICMF